MTRLSPLIIAPTQTFGRVAEKTFAAITNIITGDVVTIWAGNSVIAIDARELSVEKLAKLKASIGEEIEFHRDGNKRIVKVALGGETLVDRSDNAHIPPLHLHLTGQKRG